MHSGWPWKLREIHYKDGHLEKTQCTGSKEWKTRCVVEELTIQGTIHISRIWEGAKGLKAGSKTGRMKRFTSQVQWGFIEYSRLEVI